MPSPELFARYLAAKAVLFAGAGAPLAVLAENPIHGQVLLFMALAYLGAAILVARAS